MTLQNNHSEYSPTLSHFTRRPGHGRISAPYDSLKGSAILSNSIHLKKDLPQKLILCGYSTTTASLFLETSKRNDQLKLLHFAFCLGYTSFLPPLKISLSTKLLECCLCDSHNLVGNNLRLTPSDKVTEYILQSCLKNS